MAAQLSAENVRVQSRRQRGLEADLDGGDHAEGWRRGQEDRLVTPFDDRAPGEEAG